MFLKFILHYFLIKRSGLFDKAHYLTNNPDVRQVDVNPLVHFINHGWREGRNPSIFFDTDFYLSRNRDVQNAEINPLIHYIKFGRFEGRQPSKNFSGVWTKRFEPVDKKHPIRYLFQVIFLNHRMTHSPTTVGDSDQFIIEKRPLISIIIPVYNALAYTKACIQNLLDNSDSLTYEVIVIDNGSKTETKAWLESAEEKNNNIHCIYLDSNFGFAPAVNKGITCSTGDFVVILNNDTIPAPGWLEKLHQALINDPHLGIVSPVTNYIGEGNQIDTEANHIQPDEVKDYAKKIADRIEVLHEPSRLVFFCVMIRRTVIDLIGLLDEGYVQGNFEDDDYCLRARSIGYKLGIVKNAFVFHHGSVTFKENKFDYSAHFEENRKRYYFKTGRLASNFPMFSKKLWRTSKPIVSIIVRTVNRPDLLELALNSLANQTCHNFEVILVNDGGPNLDNLLGQYKMYFPIQYIPNKQSQGRTHALNTGVSTSSGKWITFLDDDDIYYPWHLETMINNTKQFTNTHFFYGMYNRSLINITESHHPILVSGQPPFNFSRRSMLLGNSIPIHTWCISKTIFDELGGFDETFDTLEDYEFILKVSQEFPIKLVNKVICEYRFYLGQINSVVRLREDSLIALQRIYDRYPPLDNEMRIERQELIKLHQLQCEKMEKLIGELDDCTEENKFKLYLKMLSIVGAI